MYELVSQPIDLSVHRGVKHGFNSLLHPRRPDGEFAKKGDGSTRTRKTFSIAKNIGGAHLTTSSESAEHRFKTGDVSLEESSTKIDVAVKRLRSAKPGSTEYEHAALELKGHAETLRRRVEDAERIVSEHKYRVHVQGASSSFDSSVYRISTQFKNSGAAKVADYLGESGKDATTTKLGSVAAGLGAKIAGAVAGLIGAGATEHFTEAFHKITENGTVEAGINVAVAWLLAALAATIQRALAKRKDKKIAKARGEL